MYKSDKSIFQCIFKMSEIMDTKFAEIMNFDRQEQNADLNCVAH